MVRKRGVGRKPRSRVEFTNKFRAAPGFHLTDAQAQIIGPALKDIYDRHGDLDPRTMLGYAINQSHPLHAMMDTWDVRRAAELHWCEYLKYLRRGIEELVITRVNGRVISEQWMPVATNIRIVDPADVRRWSAPLVRGLADDDRLGEMTSMAAAHMQSFVDKFQLIQGLEQVVALARQIVDLLRQV